MKKAKLLMLGLTSLALASCSLFGGKDKDEKTYDYNPTITGGTAEEQTAILEALNNRPMANLNGKTSTEIFPYPDSYMTLKEDDGDGIKITKSQAMGDLTVKITWSIDESQEYYGGRKESDAAHDIIEIKYKGFEDENGNPNPEGSFEWKISKMECGGAVAENANIVFKAKVKNEEFYHDNISIADIYAFQDKQETINGHKFDGMFDLVDYSVKEGASTYSPYFKIHEKNKDNGGKYYYVNVTGEVIYLAPDGNWGLIADGDEILELYAGSGQAFTKTNWPNLDVGKVVTVSGNLSQYQGSINLGFVTKIREASAEDAAKIASPSKAFKDLTETKIASFKSTYIECQKQAIKIDGVDAMNSLRTITGTIVKGSLLVKGEEKNATFAPATAITSSKLRAMFKVKVGAEEIYVAYDYHVDKENDKGIFSKLSALNLSDDETEHTFKGTLRYYGNDLSSFITEANPGMWSLVPFAPDHIA